ncbi:protein FAM133 isoform X2 [Halyomorpha halys]|uniref:protein FAM133 isoform X2 n=1 Tax=Halyomorpha halys TaxID=286706 RepID=UPI0006D4EDD2|nr:uncharacterized protein LOC106691735 isoform X2 [Halyomorpha halys]
MDQFDDIKMSDSDDDEGAGERVRMIMEEIYKNQDKIKSEKDIEEMAERCTSMMTQMRNEAYIKKKEKKGQRSSGAGDKASPPPSRISSVKESPRKDSTKAAGNPLFPPPGKSALKSPMEYKKKTQKTPNFSELYKEKMEKMRVPGKIDLKGSQTKTDSTKPSKAKIGMGDVRRKMVEDSNDSESESSSMNSESDSLGSEELQKILDTTKNSDKIMKEFKARESYRGVGKEVDAHRKTADWMSSTRGELAKKKEGAGSSKMMAAAKANQNLSFFSSSDMDSEDEKIAQQLKSKMTLSSKKPPLDNKETARKLLSSISEKPKGTLPPKAGAAPLKRPTIPAGAPKVAVSRPGPAEKAKPRKKM